jgi:hypothetical protein
MRAAQCCWAAREAPRPWAAASAARDPPCAAPEAGHPRRARS